MKLQMLFYSGYHDHPLDGLALFNGKEVYFVINPLPQYLKEEEYTPDIKTIINQLKHENEEYRYIQLKDYDIDYDLGEVFVQRKIKYDLYQLPKELHEKFKNQHVEFSEAVGYHCWHHPMYYKPYVAKDNTEYYNKKKELLNINQHLDEYEYLGTFQYNEFEYYDRPF